METAIKQIESEVIENLENIVRLLVNNTTILQVFKHNLSDGLYGTKIVFDTIEKETYTILTEKETLDFSTFKYANNVNLQLLKLHLCNVLLIKRIN